MTTTTNVALDLMKKLGEKTFKEKSTMISDVKITLRNISSKYESEIYEAVGDMKGTAFFNLLKVKTLVKSIVMINDEKFENSEEEELKKEEILKSLPSTVIDELYKVYSDLCNEIDIELGFAKPEPEASEDDTEETEENNTETVM